MLGSMHFLPRQLVLGAYFMMRTSVLDVRLCHSLSRIWWHIFDTNQSVLGVYFNDEDVHLGRQVVPLIIMDLTAWCYLLLLPWTTGWASLIPQNIILTVIVLGTPLLSLPICDTQSHHTIHGLFISFVTCILLTHWIYAVILYRYRRDGLGLAGQSYNAVSSIVMFLKVCLSSLCSLLTIITTKCGSWTCHCLSKVRMFSICHLLTDLSGCRPMWRGF